MDIRDEKTKKSVAASYSKVELINLLYELQQRIETLEGAGKPQQQQQQQQQPQA